MEKIDILDSKTTRHDRYRFETKLDIDLSLSDKSSYKIETYFFIPQSLNINADTFKKKDFYNHSQRYVRWKTPQIGLKKMADLSDAGSSSGIINRHLDAMFGGKADEETILRLCEEFRIFGAVLRGAMKTYLQIFFGEISALDANPDAASSRIISIEESANKFLKDLRLVISAVREIRIKLLSPSVNGCVRENFYLFDEFASLTITEYLSALLSEMRANEKIKGKMPSADKEICAILSAQNNYSRAMNYPTAVKNGALNAVFSHRRGLLKKFVFTPFFLKASVLKEERTANIAVAVAGGSAMFIGLLALIIAQHRFAVNSMPFVLTAVAIYIFRDRIKDWGKTYLLKNWTKWVYDRRTKIYESDSASPVGLFKEAVSFIPQQNISPEICRRRSIDDKSSADGHSKSELVMKCEREVFLFPDKIVRNERWKQKLKDIFRFNIAPFLLHADDPHVDYPHYDEETNAIKKIVCPRAYHINVITKYSLFNKGELQRINYERIRIVFTSDGILRLEEVNV